MYKAIDQSIDPLYCLYVGDITFFLKNRNLLKELLNTINYFSSFTLLKPNLCKCEVAGIGALKKIKVEIYGIKCIDLTKDAIKILGVFIFFMTKICSLKTTLEKQY